LPHHRMRCPNQPLPREIMTMDASTGRPFLIGTVSVLMGFVGIITTWVWMRRLYSAAPNQHNAYFSWSLGILAVLPAWLLVFVHLIPARFDGHSENTGAVVWLCSIALGLSGAIMSQARLRHLRDSAAGLSPSRAWSLGVWTMIPAWAAMLLALLTVLAAA